jgi:DNA-binding IclR family transcriptional regulator
VSSKSSTHTALRRAIGVLELFDMGREQLSLSEISGLTGVPVASAFRILQILTELGVLERDGAKSYSIGTKLWELGTRSSRLLNLRDVAMPFMEGLQRTVRQHTMLSVLVDGEALVVECLVSRNDVPFSRVGGRLPLHAASPGLLLLAMSDGQKQEKVLGSRLPRYTPQTIVSPDALRQQLSQIRRQGFAVAEETINAGSGGIAVPIYGPQGEILAALSVTYGKVSVDYQGILPPLLFASRSISKALATP